MITGNRIFEARELLDMAQRGGDIFGQTAKDITHWMDRYADYRTAWHHGILHHLESWVEENEESTTLGCSEGQKWPLPLGSSLKGCCTDGT